MTPVMTPRQHGYIDYIAVIALIAAPYTFAFSPGVSSLCVIAALSLLVMSLFTRYPMGVFKVVPFTLHGTAELIAAPLLIISPWALGFEMEYSARNFFVVAGIALFGLWAFTNYRAADLEEQHTLDTRKDLHHPTPDTHGATL